MKYILDTKKSNFQKEFSRALNSKRQQSNINRSVVLKIINDVKRNGDQSLIKYSKKFDKIDLNKNNIQISNKEIISITSKLDPKIKKAINLAYSRVKSFHLKQVSSPFKFKDKFGNQLGYKYSPINKVGIYIPGGKASYPSTVIMNCVPAVVRELKIFMQSFQPLITKLMQALFMQLKYVVLKKFLELVVPKL